MIDHFVQEHNGSVFYFHGEGTYFIIIQGIEYSVLRPLLERLKDYLQEYLREAPDVIINRHMQQEQDKQEEQQI